MGCLRRLKYNHWITFPVPYLIESNTGRDTESEENVFFPLRSPGFYIIFIFILELCEQSLEIYYVDDVLK